MEKQQEAAADSISSVGVQMKEYPPSEVYSTEPPPVSAYVRPRATAVQIARIAAVTLIAVSFILGFFMVASAYITATATCYQDYPLPPQENVEDRPQYQHLVVDPLDSEESAHTKQESVVLPQQEQQQEQQSQEHTVHLKLPLQLDFDELAGSMIEKNQRSRMNCVVEKRRAEEVTDHQPRTVRLPFGVNISSDPRYEHITGERMAIFCESGADQRHVPMEQQMTPMAIPIPIHQVPIHPNAIPQQVPFHPNNIPQVPPQFHPHAHQRPSMEPPQHQMPPHMIPQQVQIQPHQIIHQMPPQQLPPQFHPHQAILQQAIHQIEQQALHHSPEEHQVIIQVEEEIVPVMRGFQHPEVPADTVRPPPLPFHRLPVHLPQPQQQQMQQQQQQESQPRPHYVQPRSVRSVDNVLLHRDKRVRRCACDCAC
nr:mediator of RNA polymerase II transcription subunit 15 isoform X1 [Halyomorpha halys]